MPTMPAIHMKLHAVLFTACFLLLPPGRSAAAPQADCILLAGGGRSAAADPQINEGWNRLNFAFFDAALTLLGTTRHVVPTFFTLGAGDPTGRGDQLLRDAARNGCTQIMITTVFDDPGKAGDELVFAVRVVPVQWQPSAARGDASRPRWGPPQYQREYRFAATPATLSKVVPSHIAQQAVDGYLAKGKR